MSKIHVLSGKVVVGDEDQWITIKGAHVLIGENGEVKGGAGGALKGRKLSGAKSTGGSSSSSKGKSDKEEAAYIKKRAEIDNLYNYGEIRSRKEYDRQMSELNAKYPEAGRRVFEKEAPTLMKSMGANRKELNKLTREEVKLRKKWELTKEETKRFYEITDRVGKLYNENQSALREFQRRYESKQIDKDTYRKAIIASEGKRTYKLDDLDDE